MWGMATTPGALRHPLLKERALVRYNNSSLSNSIRRAEGNDQSGDALPNDDNRGIDSHCPRPLAALDLDDAAFLTGTGIGGFFRET